MKTKILFVASEFAAGMIPFATKIITLLSKNEHYDVYAIVFNSENQSYKEKLHNLDSIHLIQLEYPKRKVMKLIYKFYPFSLVEAIKQLNKQECFDVIHLLTGDFILAPYVLMYRNKIKRNWYYTVHDLYPHEIKTKTLFGRLLHKYIDWGYKCLCDRIENLTTSSKIQYKDLQKIYPSKHVVFTHFPSLVTSQIVNGKKPVVELLHEKNYILFFGAVGAYKGVDLLIKAYINSTRLKDIKLVIAGKGLSYEDIIINNKSIIRINRFIDDSEVNDLFTKALFVVYPYKSATMSGVLSIAYYFQKKVLLSSLPFFRDNASDLSIFFEKENIDDLQKKMEFLVNVSDIDNDVSNKADNKDCYNRFYSDEVLEADYRNLYSV